MRAYNSTIRRKKKPCKSCGVDSFIFSRGRCEQCSRIEDALTRDEEESKKIIQEEDLSGLIEDADAIFSQYIRLKGATEKGFNSCFTCGIEKHWTILQNGHFVKRGHLYLRYDERNCKPQCQQCNEFEDGNMKSYHRELEKLFPGLPDILKEEMRIVHKPTREEIRQVIADYTPKVRELKKKLSK